MSPQARGPRPYIQLLLYFCSDLQAAFFLQFINKYLCPTPTGQLCTGCWRYKGEGHQLNYQEKTETFGLTMMRYVGSMITIPILLLATKIFSYDSKKVIFF